MTTEKLHSYRKNYGKNALDEKFLPDTPEKLFDMWFKDAEEAGITEPNAMVLATVSGAGKLSQRTVLMKAYAQEGFEFYTNYNSKKALDITSNPQVSLQFLWLETERQIRIEGKAEKVSREKSEAYFKTRPRESCISAWASPQSKIIENKSELLILKEEIEKQFAGQKIPCPDFWGGYIVKPHYYEFWQGGSNRLHDRIVYEKTANNWGIIRLAP